MNDRTPVTTLEELDALDEAEIIVGYCDGRKNEPCGGNRSKAYWHGWRDGMMDGGHAPQDYEAGVLAAAFLEREAERRKKEKSA